jgi:acyl-CoA synthetase (NDP forming)
MRPPADPRHGSLEPLLRPRSVAIIGASHDPSRIGGRPLRYMMEAGFAGAIYPVNPRRSSVQGLDAYPDIADVPGSVDFALLALPAAACMPAVEACAAKGVRAMVIFSSGFAEVGDEGRALQERIGAIGRQAGMRIVGPNCLGLFTNAIGFFPTFTSLIDTGGFPHPGNVAIVSQSGAYGSHVFLLARRRGIGINTWITTGNECDVQVPECLLQVALDDETEMIVVYAEGIRERGILLEALARARANRKPVVFMKVGRSKIGAQAARSHTAALAGADAVYDALFRQFGVHRARTTEELIDVAYACRRRIYPTGRRLGLVTLSGGVGVQMADAAEDHCLDVAPMPEDAQRELKQLLPYAAVRNPVDVTAQAFNDMSLVARNLEVMYERGNYDAIIAFFTGVAGSRYVAAQLRESLRTARERFPDQLVALSIVAPEETIRLYEEEGYLIFEDPTRAVAAVAALMAFGRSFQEVGRALPAFELGGEPLPEGPMSERAAKRLLAAAGIPVLEERLAATPDEAAKAARELGFPVALKISSPDVLHKTEIKGVVLGVRSADAARHEAEALLERARAARPDARVEGVLVAPMIQDGIETILGVSRDPVFGPVVMFGLGGVFVEVLNDVTFRIAPFDLREAGRMIGEVRGRALLEGARGAPPADIDALASALARLSEFAARHADAIESIDLNPFVVLPEGQGAITLDALIVPRAPAGASPSPEG